MEDYDDPLDLLDDDGDGVVEMCLHEEAPVTGPYNGQKEREHKAPSRNVDTNMFSGY
jgi:hypothetical protein